MKILVTDEFSGNVYTLDVMPTEEVIDVKAKIEEEAADPIHSDQQQFFFDGQGLDDNRTLASYGIVDRSVINLVVKGSKRRRLRRRRHRRHRRRRRHRRQTLTA